MSKNLISICNKEASELFIEHTLPKLKFDDVGVIASYDRLIILYANKFIIRYLDIDQQSDVRRLIRL